MSSNHEEKPPGHLSVLIWTTSGITVLGAMTGGLMPWLLYRWMRSEQFRMAGLTDYTRNIFASRIEPALPVLIVIGAGFGAAFMFWFYIRFSLSRYQRARKKQADSRMGTMNKPRLYQILISLLTVIGGPVAAGLPDTGSTDRGTTPAEQHAGTSETLILTSPETIQAPFSVYECISKLQACRNTLDLPGAEVARSRTIVNQVLKSVIRCARDLDRAYPSHQFYTWHNISKDKVPTHGIREQVFDLRRPIEGVNAISMRVKNGDVKIHSLMAYDEKGTAWEFAQPLIIPSNQPRPDFLFLPLPTSLSRVRILSSRQEPLGDKLPRLFLKAGVCSKPEAIKYALYHLKMARQSVESGELKKVREPIRNAIEMLKLFEQTRLNE